MNSKIKMFCFTYAGGAASFYNEIEQSLKDNIELVKLDYAGHGKRYREDLYSDFKELAEDMYNQVKMQCDENTPYVFMGYSMGSIVVFELLRMIACRKEIEFPKYVFLAAHEPCTKLKLLKYANEIPDDEVKKRTIKFGGIPQELVENAIFWRVYLPIYRADYSLIGMYDFDDKKDVFEVPATVFYSEQDTPFEKMRKWEVFFPHKCEFIEYTGNHFFINQHCDDMALKIIERIGEI